MLFSKGTFPRLFKKCELGSSFYLLLKAELFRLFDHITDLQHVTVPKHQNANHLADHHHESLGCERQQFTWPKMPILSNTTSTGEYSVTSQKDGLSKVERNSVTSQEDALVNAEESSVTLHTTELWESMPPNCTCTFCTFMVYVEHE